MALAKAPKAQTLLWEISGNGLKKSSYLLGTIHVGCAKRLALTPEQQKALSKSQQLYLEIDLSKPASVTSNDSIERKIPGGKKLRDFMTVAQYENLENYFGNLEEQELADLMPHNLITRASQELAEKYFSTMCSDTISKDEILMKAAIQQKMFVGGIENTADRGNALKATTIEEEVKELLQIFSFESTPTSLKETFINFQKLYINQDLVALCTEDPVENKEDLVLNERNRNWIPKMDKIMAKKPTFFAFGALHLCGDKGVISLLEAKGYTLRPIFDPKNSSLVSKTKKITLTAKDYFSSGTKKSEDGEILDAIDDYSQAIALKPQYDEVYFWRGFLKRDKMNDHQGALADFSQAIAINPKKEGYYYQRGLVKRYNLNNYKGALDDFTRAISINPKSLGSLYERGILRSEKLNDPQGALSDFNFAISYLPNESDYYIARGMLKYTKLNDKPGGISDVRRAIKIAQFKDNTSALKEALIVLRMMEASEKSTS
jgi:uncharacterized protein